VDLTRDPIERGLARGVRREVQRVRRREVQASRHGADGDEARQRAGLEQRPDGLEEHDGAEDVDLRMGGCGMREHCELCAAGIAEAR
jgi:hypothetical protein